MKSGYRIGETAKELGIHANTIRRLERLGLIKPQRNLVGHRIFNDEIITDIRKIYKRQGAR